MAATCDSCVYSSSQQRRKNNETHLANNRNISIKLVSNKYLEELKLQVMFSFLFMYAAAFLMHVKVTAEYVFYAFIPLYMVCLH